MNKKQKHHQSIIPGNTNAVNVIGSTREDLSFALKTWKRKIKHSKILERTKELTEFIESLNTKQFQEVQKFFDTMPKLKQIVELKNPKTGVKSKIVLQGLNDFFA